MYLSRLRLNHSRAAVNWQANPYRIHQRLKMACEGDPRVLFRVEDTPGGTHILVQSHLAPNWDRALADLAVLLEPPEFKSFDPQLQAKRRYRFRLLANPTRVKTTPRPGGDEPKKQRLGLLREDDQRAWLARKLNEAGAELLGCTIASRGMQRSYKSPLPNPSPASGGGAGSEGKRQTHLAVLFEGILQANDPGKLRAALENGIGSAKGFGLGLLSLAPAG
jgi:CRISPR system Cascade subunit CasE